MPYKVVVTDFDTPDFDFEMSVLEEAGLEVDMRFVNSRDPNAIIDEARDADALVVQFAPITRDVISGLSRCRVISRYGIGTDMIDIAAASERGIVVANVPDYCLDEVSTQTIAFILDLNRSTLTLDRYVRGGGWGRDPIPCEPPRRLAGQRLGIVGLGRIGRRVADKAQSMGLVVVAHDPYLSGEASEGVPLLELIEVLRSADYVSLHCPLVPQTRGLIDAAALAGMQPHAYLINMSRGPVVDQAALVAALEAGTIAGAALDVLEHEPPDPSERLIGLANTIITPHTASWSRESLIQLRRDTMLNVADVLQARVPRSVVNWDTLARGDA